MNCVYILKLNNGSLYCGWTNDPEKRLAAHNSGKGAKCTRAHLPAELLRLWELPSKRAAMSAEWHIKKLPREKKLKLISGEIGIEDILPSAEIGQFTEE